MASNPTHYFVIRSPYAQLILTGVKTFEFRTNAKTFANKCLAIAVAKSACNEDYLLEEFAYWKKKNKLLKGEDFKAACEKARKLLDLTNACGKIIGEIETSEVETLDSEDGIRILSYNLWPKSKWIDSPGGLGVRRMP